LGWLLGTTTSTRGGGHTTGVIIDARPGIDEEDLQKAKDIFGVDNPVNHLDYEGRPEMVTYMEAVHRINNCLGICHFNTIHWDFQMIDLPHLAELYSTATGWETSVDDLKELAMKQLNLEKAFNLIHTNFDRKDDMPAPREMHEPIPTGPQAGWKMDMKKYNEMLDRYYDLHGWERETSYPTRKALSDLGLDHVADDLEAIGKLGSS
jgi:aldehyde:ferredoxin oxidoreductase